MEAPSPNPEPTPAVVQDGAFQFQMRTMLAVVGLFAVGMGMSVNASVGARLSFLVSFAVFWLGVMCVTYVVDTRRPSIASSLLLLSGQMLVLVSMATMMASLCLILKSLLTPLSIL